MGTGDAVKWLTMLGPEFHPKTEAVLPKKQNKMLWNHMTEAVLCPSGVPLPQKAGHQGPSNANSGVLKLQSLINGRAQFKGDKSIC